MNRKSESYFKPVIFLLFFVILSFASLCVSAKEYFVYASNVSGIEDGSESNPFSTIAKATVLAKAGDVITVRAGVYREEVLIPDDRITFQVYNGESVTINGADLMTVWTQSSGTTYQTTMDWDLPASLRTWGSNQVFSDGKMIELARWPDQTSADIIMPTNAVANSASAAGNIVTITDADFNEPDGRWVGAQIWINLSRNGVDGQGITSTVIATNAATHTISFEIPQGPVLSTAPWGIGLNTEYFLFNPTPAGVASTGGVDALLSNGEWWKDGNNLYVKTPNGGIPSATETGTNVIEAKHRHFAFTVSTPKFGYTIKGFNLFGCSITTDNNPWNNRDVILEAAHDIVIDGITAKYVSHQTSMTGNYQDEFYYGAGIVLRGRNNTIKNCNIQYSATAAVHISGAGNKVLNNTIANTNYMVANSGALVTGFVCLDAEIANNTIYNTTEMAINFKYAKNSNVNVPDALRIHHNTIYDFLLRSGDSGAIDAAGADCQWARIDHNTIYKTIPATGNMTHGIYLDFAGYNNISRVTIDHNIIYNVPAPVLISATRYVNVFNNVLLSHADYNQNSIVNWGGGINGIDDKIFNNIMSKEPNVTGSPSFSQAIISNNINNAVGSLLDELFVDAANHDYHLKSNALAAIDKGISVGNYDESVVALPDLGAYEFGTVEDKTAPSAPSGLNAHTISNCSFTVNWTASIDNVQVTGYDVFVNDKLFGSTPNTSINVTGLLASTTYWVTVKAKDYYNNNSAASNALNVTTVTDTGRTLHLEAEDNDLRYGGTLANGIWSGYKTNSYIQYNSIPLSKQSILKAKISSIAAGAQFEVRLNSSTGPLLGILSVTSTGDLAVFQEQTTNLTDVPVGIYTLFFVSKNTDIRTCNLDWVELSGGDAVGSVPTIPQGLVSLFAGASRFCLKWVGSIDDKAVTGYEVLKNGISAGTTTSTSIILEELTALTDYKVKVRASDADGNWSDWSAELTIKTREPKLSGEILGTEGSWIGSAEDDKTAAFDGNIHTVFDCTTSDNAWTGLAFPTPKYIAAILFHPRFYWPERMVNGIFQGSNSPDFLSGVETLYQIKGKPEEIWNGVSVANATAFKYVRYKAPVGGYGNIAEIEFYGSDITNILNADATNGLQIFPNPAADQIIIRDIEKNSFVTILSIDGKSVLKKNVSVDGHLTLNVSSLRRGIYFVNVQSKNKMYTGKLILN